MRFARPTLLIAILTVLSWDVLLPKSVACAATLQAESPTCAELFEFSPEAQTAIGDHVEPFYRPQGPTIELVETRNIDQCKIGECYLSAFISMLELIKANLPSASAEHPRYSMPYLVTHKLLHVLSGTLRWGTVKYEQMAADGGQFFDAFALTRAHGLVFEKNWQPRIPYEQWDFAAIYETMHAKLFAAAGELQEIADRYGNQSVIFVAAYDRKFAELSKVFLEQSGPLPDPFRSQDQDRLPQDIEKEFSFNHGVRVVLDQVEHYAYKDALLTRRMNEITLPYGGTWSVQKMSAFAIETNILRAIDQRSPVLVDITWGSSTHTMVVAGYEMDAQGRITHWKLKNSWSANWANSGYVWYDWQDFRKNIRRSWRIESPH